MRPAKLVLALISLLASAQLAIAPARAQGVSVVAAERVYADVAGQILGTPVPAILANPAQDPHSYEPPPSVARALIRARIVVANGAGYDPWVGRLLRTSAAPRTVVLVADLVPGARTNPHAWFDPAALPALAQALAAALASADPPNAAAYAGRARAFAESWAPIDAKVAALRARHAGQPIAATEPVLGLMTDAIGLASRHDRFQRAIMNGTEPRASDVAALEADLRQRRVRLIIHNSQSTSPTADRMLRLARGAGIPVLGVGETLPANTTAQAWVAGLLGALEAALEAAPTPLPR